MGPGITKKAWRAGALLFITLAFSGFLFRPFPEPVRAVRVVQTFPIPFETDYIHMPDQSQDYVEIVKPGVQGERRVEALVLYEGSRPPRVVSIHARDMGKPIRQVVRRGLKRTRTHGFGQREKFSSPLDTGWLSADFYDYPGHNGIDLAAPYGTPVYAAAEGTVALAGWYGDYGYCVILDHPDDSRTLYAHNSRLNVLPGEMVLQGQQIAEVGSTGNSTGNHLHFEIRTAEGFLDPLLYLSP